MYFKVFITKSWGKKTGDGRRRFNQCFPMERVPAKRAGVGTCLPSMLGPGFPHLSQLR